MFFLGKLKFVNQLIGLILWLTCQLEASNLHTIIAIDLNANRIEGGMRKDLENLQREIAAIASNTHLKILEQIFIGDKSDPTELLDYLRNLIVDADDVILFYFSGHLY